MDTYNFDMLSQKDTFMAGKHRWFLALLAFTLVFAIAAGAAAQGESSGILVFGQPLPGQIAAGETLNYDYALTEPRQVTLQALGDTTQPTITILRDGEIAAQQANAEGTPTTSLSILLDAGSYVVQVGSANNTAGLVVLVLQSETAITSTALALASPISGSVDSAAPLALYSFSAVAEPAYLYVESAAPDGGATVRLVNTTTGAASAELQADLLGARLRIPAGSASYQVEVQQGDAGAPVAFTVCLASVSAGGCEAGAPLQTPEAPVDAFIPCTVTPAAAGSVNVRQSASENAVIFTTLDSGAVADVVGITPDGQYFNVLYRGYNAWLAVNAVVSSGNCGTDTILVIEPPAIVPIDQQAALQPPVQPVQPTAIPPAQLPAQPAGACLITMSGDQLIYTQPNAIPDYIYDQVHAGFELIPTGRLADNSWWQTNYANAWIQTAVFGTTAQVSGNCAGLPIVSP